MISVASFGNADLPVAGAGALLPETDVAAPALWVDRGSDVGHGGAVF